MTNTVPLGGGFHAELLNEYSMQVHVYAARRMSEPGQPFWHTDACIGFGGRHTNPVRRILADVSYGGVHLDWLHGGDEDLRGSWVNSQRVRGTANVHFVVPLNKHFFVGKGALELVGCTCNILDSDGEFVQGWNSQIDDSGRCAFFLPARFMR